MDLEREEFQLASLQEQYENVEKEMHNLSTELTVSKKKRRQLHAEVKFLRKKVRSFRENADVQKNQLHAAAVPERKKSKSKRKEEPKFYEVEVQFAEQLDPGMLNRGLLQYPSHLQDYRTNYLPHSDYRWGQGTTSYAGNTEVM